MGPVVFSNAASLVPQPQNTDVVIEVAKSLKPKSDGNEELSTSGEAYLPEKKPRSLNEIAQNMAKYKNLCKSFPDDTSYLDRYLQANDRYLRLAIKKPEDAHASVKNQIYSFLQHICYENSPLINGVGRGANVNIAATAIKQYLTTRHFEEIFRHTQAEELYHLIWKEFQVQLRFVVDQYRLHNLAIETLSGVGLDLRKQKKQYKWLKKQLSHFPDGLHPQEVISMASLGWRLPRPECGHEILGLMLPRKENGYDLHVIDVVSATAQKNQNRACSSKVVYADLEAIVEKICEISSLQFSNTTKEILLNVDAKYDVKDKGIGSYLQNAIYKQMGAILDPGFDTQHPLEYYSNQGTKSCAFSFITPVSAILINKIAKEKETELTSEQENILKSTIALFYLDFKIFCFNSFITDLAGTPEQLTLYAELQKEIDAVSQQCYSDCAAFNTAIFDEFISHLLPLKI